MNRMINDVQLLSYDSLRKSLFFLSLVIKNCASKTRISVPILLLYYRVIFSFHLNINYYIFCHVIIITHIRVTQYTRMFMINITPHSNSNRYRHISYRIDIYMYIPLCLKKQKNPKILIGKVS